jgi:hypothetical protein
LYSFERIFNMQLNLTILGRRIYSPSPKKGVLRIFVALKNQSSSAGFEPPNLESNIKHANNYTAEDHYVF